MNTNRTRSIKVFLFKFLLSTIHSQSSVILCRLAMDGTLVVLQVSYLDYFLRSI